MNDLPDVLVWINDAREKLDLPTLAEIPQGQRYSACHCPIARALSSKNKIASTISSNTLLIPVEDALVVELEDAPGVLNINHPDGIKQFINDFDAGLYPELIEQ